MRRVLEGRELADSRSEARRIRETFQARRVQKEERMPFGWPPAMQEIGSCLAVIYSSDKWKDNADYEDYKHVAEAPQVVLAVPDFLVEWHDPHRHISVAGPLVELPTPMPRHFAVLAKLLGVQVELYDTWSEARGARATTPVCTAPPEWGSSRRPRAASRS